MPGAGEFAVDRPEPSDEPSALERRDVAMWTARVQKAKAHWEADFKRMRADMDFAAGAQYAQQTSIDSSDYICNVVLRALSQKVATLYAKNPKVEAKRRKRMDFELWDEKRESLEGYANRAAVNPMDMEAHAVLADYLQGMQHREQVEKVCKTLETLDQWNMDAQEPRFKKQLKKLVRRVGTCGVGYVKQSFQRSSTGDEPVQSSSFRSSMTDRAKRAAMILQKLESGEIEDDSPQVADLQSLVNSLSYSQQEGEPGMVDERIILDFPRATSVIPDPRCTSLEDFEGGKWTCQEYLTALDDVNAMFGTKIEKGGSLVEYSEGGMEFPKNAKENPDIGQTPLVMLWEICNAVSKTRMFLVNGHDRYVVAPEPLTPCTKRFWPLFSLMFNSVEVEPGGKATIFPPSDVHLMRHAQAERNRSREAFRQHRVANKPRAVMGAGLLDEEDMKKLEDAPAHSITEVNVPSGGDLSKLIAPVPTRQITPELYETTSVDNDILSASGIQQADLGPAQPNVTATDASIAAHARSTQSSSNVDDLDELLNDMAIARGEIYLAEWSQETVARVAGRGMLWPDEQSRPEYAQQIYLEIQAGSSGRPNKALEMSNWQIMAPLLMQAGANPQFLVREGLRRLDERIDPIEAFPLAPPPQGAGPGGPPQPGGPGPGAQGLPSGQGGLPGTGVAQAQPPMPPRGNPS